MPKPLSAAERTAERPLRMRQRIHRCHQPSAGNERGCGGSNADAGVRKFEMSYRSRAWSFRKFRSDSELTILRRFAAILGFAALLTYLCEVFRSPSALPLEILALRRRGERSFTWPQDDEICR